MGIDQLSGTGNTTLGILEKTGLVENSILPSLDTLQGLAQLGTKNLVEYGVQIYEAVVNGRTTHEATFVRGLPPSKYARKMSIFEPEKPENATRGVFFHTHSDEPYSTWRYLRSFIHPRKQHSWYMLPSDEGVGYSLDKMGGGDTYANYSRKLGGYLNVVSPHGMALHVGVGPRLQGVHLTNSEWEIVAGTQKGRKYTPIQRYSDLSSVPDPIMIWKHQWPAGNSQFFLLLSWGEINRLSSVFENVENLCFGDGLEKMIKELNIDIPHENNLADVTKIWAK